MKKLALDTGRIRQLMEAQGIRQKDLAAVLFVHPQTVWQILRRGTVGERDAKLIAVTLGVDLEEIAHPLDG